MIKSGRLSWLALILASLTIIGAYYTFDSIAPIADLLRRQRGFSQTDIGLLNAIFNLPNIPLAIVGGLLIDRIGAAKAALWAAGFCAAGAGLTAMGDPFALMAFGRLIFGIGEETLLVALLACLAQWFEGGASALAMSLLFSLARVGSYMADISPRWAAPLYAQGWRPPLILATAFTLVSLCAGVGLFLLDKRRTTGSGLHGERFRWADLRSFDASFWSILGLNVLFASVFFPFRSTFAIVYFQDAKHLSLADAGLLNSWVFFTAIFATPIFGSFADRFGHRAALLAFGAALMPLNFLLLALLPGGLWITTALMGLSFSVIPAVIWPSTAMLVPKERLGAAFGVINVLQSLGMFACNYLAGWLNDLFGAGPRHPQGYMPMLAMFMALSLISFGCTLLLWRRERSQAGHGLERPAKRFLEKVGA